MTHRGLQVAIAAGFATMIVATAAAQDANLCDTPGEAPDLILGDIHTVMRFGTLDGKTAFSLGPTTCNLGSCQADYGTTHHPVLAQNMYRLRDGQFEQIGQSWLFHAFVALAQAVCSADCLPSSGGHLGVKCSTSDSQNYTGVGPNLGPRSEVDPSTGIFPFPPTGQGQSGDVLFRRLQVHNEDLDPADNAGAAYFVEGQLVARDDAAGGNGGNNASWRTAIVSGTSPNFFVALSSTTRRQEPAIFAWKEYDPAVLLQTAAAPDGVLVVGSRATALGGQVWRYEYAVQNLTSQRSVGSFTVPLPPGAHLTAAGFHDVDYHSGEPFVGADWPAVMGNDGGTLTIAWATTPFAVDPNANALRWGTLYNFRFEADVPPDSGGTVKLGLFRPGLPASVTATAVAPHLCDADATCEPGETSCNCPGDCGASLLVEESCGNSTDDDCDALVDCADADCCAAPVCAGADADGDGFGLCDCDDASDAVWSVPDEVGDVTLSRSGVAGATELHWVPPSTPGAVAIAYQVLRAAAPTRFAFDSACVADADPTDISAVDDAVPAPASALFYLVRAANGCPNGLGALGRGSDQVPRSAPACP